jgi:predicted ATP-dependent endonuclease of OLD family
MKIDSIKVEDYRGFECFEMKEISPITVFVGRNNTGKSTLLEAFAMASSASSGWYDCLGEDLLEAIAEKRGGASFSGVMVKIGATESKISFSGIDSPNGQVKIAKNIDAISQDFVPKIMEDIDKYVAKTLEMAINRSIEREGLPRSAIEARRADFQAEHERAKRRFFKNIKAFVTYIDATFDFALLTTGNTAFERDFRVYEKPREEILRLHETISRKSDVNYMLEPSSGYLRELQRKLVESGEMLHLINFIKKRIDYFEDIREVNGHFYVSIKGLERPIPLESMGDGFRAQIAILSGISLAQGGLVLIEEPEIRLHPGFMSLIARQIIETAKNTKTQYVISTHSSEFLDFLLKEAFDMVKVVRLYRSEETNVVDYEILDGKTALEETVELNADLRGI